MSDPPNHPDDEDEETEPDYEELARQRDALGITGSHSGELDDEDEDD